MRARSLNNIGQDLDPSGRYQQPSSDKIELLIYIYVYYYSQDNETYRNAVKWTFLADS